MIKKLIKKFLGDTKTFHGQFVVRLYKAGTKELQYESPVIHNRIVVGNGYGRNLIVRKLGGDNTYGIEIDSAKIGTGTNTPVDGDTDLQTSVLTITNIPDKVIVNDSVEFTFFIPSGDLPNGVYTEFGLFIGGRLFSRAIISPSFTKGSNQDATFTYLITLS